MFGLSRKESTVCIGTILIAASMMYYSAFGGRVVPALEAVPPLVDKGVVNEGLLRGEFSLVNNSDRQIQILGIQKSCACNEVVVRNEPLEAGESRTGSFTWDVAGRNGETVSKIIVHYCPVGEEDRRESLVLKLKGDVRPEFTISSRSLVLSRANHPAESVLLRPGSNPEAKLASAKSTHPNILATIIDGCRLEVKLAGPVESGMAFIELGIASAVRPTETIEVRVMN